jgi:hypothetical protein
VVIKHESGFISANIHRGFDGTRVVNYAQWRRSEYFEATVQKPQVEDSASGSEPR